MIRIERKGSCVRASLYGEIDHCAASVLREEIEKAIGERQIKSLLIDFSNVTFMDSSGVGMLIGRYRTMSERGGSMLATGLSSQTEKLFKMAGLHRIITIIDKNGSENEHE